jgi:hypothetical protein
MKFKDEDFVISTICTQRDRRGVRLPERLHLLLQLVHADRLAPPREAAGQLDLLPSWSLPAIER